MYARLVAFATSLTFILLGVSQAQVVGRVEISRNVYHVAACPGPDRPGVVRCHAHVVTDRGGNPLERMATRNVLPSGFGPADLQSAYNVVHTASGITGPTIAIVDAYGYSTAETDLGVYRQEYGLPPCTTANGCFKKVNQNGVQGNYPRTNTGWDQEQALDLDMVSAICPQCHIILVQSNSANDSDLATSENTAAAMGAHAISNSYGGGEKGSQSFESAYNHPGIAITVSSGDSGFGVQFPASSPHVTAVGGTSLVRASNARGWTETVWSGAGSGCSTVYGKPSWQHDPLCGMRMEADVSAVADPSTGVAVYGPANAARSAWLVFGGTSVAAPLTAGIYGLNGGSVNFGSNPYASAGPTWPYGTNPRLNVVTSGSNGSCGGTYFCTASPTLNYNGPAGLGTPNTASTY